MLLELLTSGAIALSSPQDSTTITREDVMQEPKVKLILQKDSQMMFWGFPFTEVPTFRFGVDFNIGKGVDVSLMGISTSEDNKYIETDVFLNKNIPLYKKVSSNVGGIGFRHLDVPKNKWYNSGVVYAGIDIDVPLNPSLYFNKLIGDANKWFNGKSVKSGNYIEAGLAHGFKVWRADATVSAKLGYNDKALRNRSGLSHVETGLNVSVPIPEGNRIDFNLNHIKSLEGQKDIKDRSYIEVKLIYPIGKRGKKLK